MGQTIVITIFTTLLVSIFYYRRFWVILFVVLSKCWFPLFTTLLAILIFLGAPQGREFVSEVEFYKSGTRSLTSLFALWMWGYNCQKLARTTLELVGTLKLSGHNHDLARALTTYVPGFIGLFPFLCSVLVFAHIQEIPDLIILSLLVIEAWFFLMFLLIREKKLHDPGLGFISLRTLNMLSLYLFQLYFKLSRPVNRLFDKLLNRDPQFIAQHTVEKSTMKGHWRANMNGEQFLNWGVHALVYLSVGIWPIYFSKFLGPIGLIFIVLSFFCILGTVFSYLRKRTRLPLFQFLIITVVVFTLVNENNKAGVIEENENDPRMDLRAHFEKWLTGRVSQKDTFQVTLVAAEGGGLRSAYWTYGVLRQLQLDNPEFYRHLYAISPVSGGSVGAALFCTEQLEGLSLQLNKAPIINDDNITAMLCAFLYRELIQSVIPLGLERLDRSRVMNKTFETHWRNKHPDDKRWGSDFLGLWQSKTELPALFLNSIHVESGESAVFSNLRFDFSQIKSLDMMHLLKSKPSLSEAVGLSSRFMYLQPAGKFEYPNGKTWGHIADGGYYDNSGVSTIFQVYLNIRKVADKLVNSGKVGLVKFNIILISNVRQSYSDPKSSFLNEIAIPTKAMLNSWYSRVYSYENIVKSTMPEIRSVDHFFEFKLNREEVPLPLGWLLSEKSRKEIVRQVQDLKNDENYKQYNQVAY